MNEYQERFKQIILEQPNAFDKLMQLVPASTKKKIVMCDEAQRLGTSRAAIKFHCTRQNVFILCRNCK